MSSLTSLLKNHAENIIERYDTEYEMPQIHTKLSSVNKNALAQKILCIPNDYLTILFMKYYFKLDNGSISSFTKKFHIAGHLHYINELLCTAMGLPEDAYIHADTLKSACRIAMSKYYISQDSATTLSSKYSKKFRKSLKTIPAAQHQPNMIVFIARRVAIVALATLVSLTATLAANAEIRARFFEWVRNTFPEFTEFGATRPTEMLDVETHAEFLLLRPHYIPDGFSLLGEPFYSPISTSRTYVNDYGHMINFMSRIPDAMAAFDTEDVVVEEIEFLGQPAFTWERRGITYFIWQQYGFEFSITAELTINDIKNIAESVRIHNN